MKKTKKCFEWNKVTPLSKYLTMALFILLPFAGFWLGMRYQNNTESIGDSNKPTYSLSTTDMVSRGIHPDPVDIKVIKDITSQWQDEGVAYAVEEVYLAPDIADLGPSRNNLNMKDKSFLIVKINVRDRRKSGDRRQVTTNDHLRIRIDQQDATPVVGDYLYLSPQENGTAYVTFSVERNTSQFNLLVGTLSTPRVIELDFDSNDAETKEGVFILKKGYFSEYSSDLHN
jgi:hypothetical protein